MSPTPEMRKRLLAVRRELNNVVRDLDAFGPPGKTAQEHLDDAFDGIAGALRQFPARTEDRDDAE